jgi:hypothetical protein
LEEEVAESPWTGRNVNKPSMTGPEKATSLPSEEYTVIPLSLRMNRLAAGEPIDSALCIRIWLVITVTLDEGRYKYRKTGRSMCARYWDSQLLLDVGIRLDDGKQGKVASIGNTTRRARRLSTPYM